MSDISGAFDKVDCDIKITRLREVGVSEETSTFAFDYWHREAGTVKLAQRTMKLAHRSWHNDHLQLPNTTFFNQSVWRHLLV